MPVPRNIIHWNRPNFAGPFFVDFHGTRIKTLGNYFGAGRPGSGPKAVAGIVLTETTMEIRFTQCVQITAGPFTGIEYRVNGGTWTTVTGRTGSDTTWVFTVGTINPGQTVDWRYVGGSGTITDCDESEDIGDQQIPVQNPLVLAGNFILLESGGMDKFLLEDDTTQEDGILQEDAPP